ncbi:phage tail tip lysozyme [Phyllobacteriaceae bacterium JZ32]
MANKRREAVGYQKFRANPLLAEGLLSVARDNGDLERRVAEGLFRTADVFGAYGDRYAEQLGEIEGRRAALDGAPGAADVTGEALPSVPEGSPSSFRLSGTGTSKAASGKAGKYKTYLMQKHGVADWMASAIVGNLQQESSLQPTGAVGDNGTAFGLAQWRGDRFANLQRFASARGKSWEDEETQLDFIMHELSTTERTAGEALRASRNVEEATAAFIGFERPAGWTPQNPRAGHGWGNRLAYARSVASQVDAIETGAAPPSPPGVSAEAARAVAAPGVVPVSQPVKVSGGKGGDFRPTGRGTVYGRAFDATGTKTYLQMLDATMRQDISRVFEAGKSDPDLLRRQFEALKTLHLDAEEGHVFEEIRPEYEAAFAKMTAPLILQADRDAQKRVEEQNKVAFLNRAQELETDIQRRLAAMTPDNPLAPGDLEAAQTALDEHYDTAVAHGILNPVQAQQAKTESRRETALSFYSRQAENLSASEIADMREKMREDFAAGELDGLDAEGWQKLDNFLQRQERVQQTRAKQATAAISKRGNTLTARIAAGFDIDQAELGRLMLDGNTSPEGQAIVRETISKISIGRAIRDLPIGEAEKHVRGLEQDLGQNPDAEQLRVATYARKTLDEKRKILATDPVTYGERMGVVDPTPTLAEVNTPDDLGAMISARVDNAKVIGEHYGVPPRYLKAGEAAAIGKLVKGDPAQGAAIAGAIIDSAGEDAPALLKEFGRDAPEIEQAGSIIAAGGAAAAAEDVIAGHGKGPDGKAYKSVPPVVRRTEADGVIGAALVAQPKEAARVQEAAHAIARKRLADAGLEANSEEGRQVFRRAINEAAGAIYDGDGQWGGMITLPWRFFGRSQAQVYVPNTIRADMFEDVIGALRDEDFERMRYRPIDKLGRPYPASAFQKAIPVAVKGGYRFAMGDPASPNPMYIRDERGQPFVLNIENMAEILGPRVPGAIRGY